MSHWFLPPSSWQAVTVGAPGSGYLLKTAVSVLASTVRLSVSFMPPFITVSVTLSVLSASSSPSELASMATLPGAESAHSGQSYPTDLLWSWCPFLERLPCLSPAYCFKMLRVAAPTLDGHKLLINAHWGGSLTRFPQWRAAKFQRAFSALWSHVPPSIPHCSEVSSTTWGNVPKGLSFALR